MSEVKKILIFGLLYIESVLQVKGESTGFSSKLSSYCDINMLISGDGIYTAKALSSLGNKVNLVSLVGNDFAGKLIRSYLSENGIDNSYITGNLKKTLLSVVRRNENGIIDKFNDFKELDNLNIDYSLYTEVINDCNVAILESNFISKKLVNELCKLNKLIVMNIKSNEIDNELVKYANVLFVNGCKEELANEVIEKVKENDIVILSYLDKGCMIYVKEGKCLEWFPKVKTRKVINYSGVEESILASFINCYCNGETIYTAIEKAMAFSSYKTGGKNNLDGFISEEQLIKLHHFLYN